MLLRLAYANRAFLGRGLRFASNSSRTNTRPFAGAESDNLNMLFSQYRPLSAPSLQHQFQHRFQLAGAQAMSVSPKSIDVEIEVGEDEENALNEFYDRLETSLAVAGKDMLMNSARKSGQFPSCEELLQQLEQSQWATEKQTGSWLNQPNNHEDEDADANVDDSNSVIHQMSSVLKKRHKKMKKHKHRKRLKKTRAVRRRYATRKENEKLKREKEEEQNQE